MTLNHGSGERETAMADFWYLLWELNAVGVSKVFRLIGVMDRYTQLPHSKVKYKFILVLEGVVPAVANVIARTPYSVLMTARADFFV